MSAADTLTTVTEEKSANILRPYSTYIVGFIIIVLSIIIQLAYYVAWMLCDSYFYPKN